MHRATDVSHARALSPWGGAAAWRRGDTGPAEWRVAPGAQALSEIERELSRIEGDAARAVARERCAGPMPASARFMGAVRERLDVGPGVAIVEGLPLDGLSDAGSSALAGLMCSLLAPVVSQTCDGKRLYEVHDTGQRPRPGLRRSLTNVGQPFHTDGPWVENTAQYIALLCVRQGSVGGVSRLASLVTAHDRLLDEAPDQLERLYEAFWWDRQREHAPGDRPARQLAVFESRDGERRARHYSDYVRAGHRLADDPLDEEGEAALASLDAILEEPQSNLEFTLRAGEMLILDNRRLVHARTAFDDSGAQAGPRQLVRVWMRFEGTGALDG